VIVEADAVTEATRTRIAPYGGMLFAALRGREAEASERIETAISHARAVGEGLAVQWARWSTAVLCNGLGRYGEALVAAKQASEDMPDFFASVWALPELIEAATRVGQDELGAEALDRLVGSVEVSRTSWGLGMAARSRALLRDGGAAESCYREAIEHLRATRLRPELARTHLLFGEWLRRDQRRVEAREQLRIAHAMLASMGADGFAERARHELLATGAHVQGGSNRTRSDLTAQEDHIAKLASDGRTNVQIGTELYLSARTVEWHLKKVFIKLGISSRKELREALPTRPPAASLA